MCAKLLVSFIVIGFLRYVFPALVRRLAPPDPQLWLPEDEFAAARKRFDRLEIVCGVLFLLLASVLAYVFAALLFHLLVNVVCPVKDAVYDGRAWGWWLVPGSAAGFCAAWLAGAATLRLYLGDDADSYDRYLSTKHRWDPKSSRLWHVAAGLLITAVLGWMAWNNGIIIDQHNMRIRIAWYNESWEYHDVKEVQWAETPDAVNDNGTQSGRARLTITFTNGERMILAENTRGLDLQTLQRVAEYVRARADGGDEDLD